MQARYNAFYQDEHSCIIYKHHPNDGTLHQLPQEAVPAEDPQSTYYRTDGGDPFEFALFRTNLGQLVVVQRFDYDDEVVHHLQPRDNRRQSLKSVS